MAESTNHDKHTPPFTWRLLDSPMKSISRVSHRHSKGVGIRDYAVRGKSRGKWADVTWDNIIFTTPQGIQRGRIEGLFFAENWGEVGIFLDRHPYLGELLFEVHTQIQTYFPTSEIGLEVIVDPESLSEEHLTAYIHTSLSPEEAADRLDQFNEEWWFDAFYQGQEKLFINLAFL